MRIKSKLTRKQFFEKKIHYESKSTQLFPICALVRLDGAEYQLGKERYFVPYNDKSDKQLLREGRINKLRKINGKKLLNFDPIYKIKYEWK